MSYDGPYDTATYQRMSDPPEVKITDSPRPETPEAEREFLHDAYRAALEEIADILQVPGSPSLLSMPERLRERLAVEAEGGDVTTLSTETLRAVLREAKGEGDE